jgi:hypothetical protein
MSSARFVCTLILVALVPVTAGAATTTPDWMPAAVESAEQALVAQYGADSRASIRRGLDQVAEFWRPEDGDQSAFERFASANYAGDPVTRDALFDRFETLLESVDGHVNEIVLAMRRQTDLELGPILPFDRVAAGYSPGSHFNEDWFANKLAFTILLNFPLTTLEQRLSEGDQWTRRQWAETRLADRFARRIPAEVGKAVSAADSRADQYIADYNIWMHHLLDGQGRRLFPPKMKLLTHWNLRDQIKADYSEADGLPRQRMIQRVMERIIDQTIPAVVIDNPTVDWEPYSNAVSPAAVSDSDRAPRPGQVISDAPEADTRYAILLEQFHAMQQLDRYSPTAPTHIDRRFQEDREIPEQRVEAMLRQILSSPLFAEVGALIASRLGRPLEPFDIWYNGFKPRGTYSEAQLDAITRERYPDAGAYEADMPRLLRDLGFSPARAEDFASKIVVEPARGSGHAWGAAMRGAMSRLRTRVGPEGMDYKGYNIAVHEMGHNVEQTISLYEIDYYSLQGVPNTAFTEALAFVFQARDLELLGLAQPDAMSQALQVLDDFWGAAEIGAVALVDMGVWHWMYDHPEATPAQLRQATLAIAREVWNDYFAPVFGQRDVTLLGVYSHMIHSRLYLPDYPIGAMIALQIEQQVERAGDLGGEFERMSRIGRLTPDLWMQQASGAPVGPEAMLAAAAEALAEVTGTKSASARVE